MSWGLPSQEISHEMMRDWWQAIGLDQGWSTVPGHVVRAARHIILDAVGCCATVTSKKWKLENVTYIVKSYNMLESYVSAKSCISIHGLVVPSGDSSVILPELNRINTSVVSSCHVVATAQKGRLPPPSSALVFHTSWNHLSLVVFKKAATSWLDTYDTKYTRKKACLEAPNRYHDSSPSVWIEFKI